MANVATVKKQSGVSTFTAGGQEISLSVDIIKRQICPNATDQEAMYFLALCKSQGLNPFVRDAYMIKYGNQAAQMVVGKDAYMKRAESIPEYDGLEAGVIAMNEKGNIEYRQGALVLLTEEVVGGWCVVYRKDKKPTRIEVTFNEYVQRKSDGSINSMWSTKPATMIRKVAISQALREAFPNAYGNTYAEEEISDSKPITVPVQEVEEVKADTNKMDAPF